MAAYLRTFQKSTEAELAQHKIEGDAKRCVILAVKVATVIDFADILKLNAVKFLEDVSDYLTNECIEKQASVRFHESLHLHRDQRILSES